MINIGNLDLKRPDIMNILKLSLLLSFFVLLILGCKKEDEILVDPYTPNVSPCSIPEEIFEIDSIIYGPTIRFPHATMTITFLNTNRQFAFNKIPETGMYHMVPNLIGSYAFENQIATVADSGSFLAYSYVTDSPEVYIENYNNELIISYCDLSNNGYSYFDQTINAYIGNPAGNRKIRMSY